jgi:Protein of unknown function (DUF559)
MVEIPGMIHGACTREHAIATIGAYRVREAIRAGALVALWPRVLVLGPRQLDSWTRAAAATLTTGVGAVICGPTAALLHGCTAARTAAVHVGVPYCRWVRPQEGLKVRHGHIRTEDVCRLDGLPVVVLEAAIGELLCTGRSSFALACADQAMTAQPDVQRAAFAAAITEYLARRPDRRGLRQARALLDLISGDVESPRESWLRLLVVEAGFPPPVVQFSVCDLDGRVIWRLDMAWPDLRIALEYDGYEAHAGRAVQDEAREEDLRNRGWIVVRARAADLRNPGRVLDELTVAFRQRGGTYGGWRATAV